MLLGVVTELEAVPGHDATGVRLLDAGQEPQKCRLAGAVEAEDDDFRAAVDRKVYSCEHLEGAVGLRQPFRGERDAARRRRFGEAQARDLVLDDL